MEADLRAQVEKHGPGIYSVLLFGTVDGEREIFSDLSFFHEVVPPDTYDPAQWDTLPR